MICRSSWECTSEYISTLSMIPYCLLRIIGVAFGYFFRIWYVYFRWRNMGDLVFTFYDVVSISYVTSRTTKSYTWPIWISGQGSDAAVTDCTQHSWTDFQVKIVKESKPPTATDSSVELKLTTVRDSLCPFIFIIAIKCKIVAVISNTNRLAPGQ